jgi:hypothetical protein
LYALTLKILHSIHYLLPTAWVTWNEQLQEQWTCVYEALRNEQGLLYIQPATGSIESQIVFSRRLLRLGQDYPQQDATPRRLSRHYAAHEV